MVLCYSSHFNILFPLQRTTLQHFRASKGNPKPLNVQICVAAINAMPAASQPRQGKEASGQSSNLSCVSPARCWYSDIIRHLQQCHRISAQDSRPSTPGYHVRKTISYRCWTPREEYGRIPTFAYNCITAETGSEAELSQAWKAIRVLGRLCHSPAVLVMHGSSQHTYIIYIRICNW